eukprot:gb/GECG01008957.1/.p1 GENE.gb/GECG01008957.1/~~gb/GECG01008957.1/.p1  ORF type:complete len:193 (+),score=5.27 gb/GECG01008957.1/:1-579(+)
MQAPEINPTISQLVKKIQWADRILRVIAPLIVIRFATFFGIALPQEISRCVVGIITIIWLHYVFVWVPSWGSIFSKNLRDDWAEKLQTGGLNAAEDALWAYRKHEDQLAWLIRGIVCIIVFPLVAFLPADWSDVTNEGPTNLFRAGVPCILLDQLVTRYKDRWIREAACLARRERRDTGPHSSAHRTGSFTC